MTKYHPLQALGRHSGVAGASSRLGPIPTWGAVAGGSITRSSFKCRHSTPRARRGTGLRTVELMSAPSALQVPPFVVLSVMAELRILPSHEGVV